MNKKTLLLLIKRTLNLCVLVPSFVMAYTPPPCMVGEIRAFSGNYAPRNWMFAGGDVLEVSRYTQLYSVIGDSYKPPGVVQIAPNKSDNDFFYLPFLKGRIPIGAKMETTLPGAKSVEQSKETKSLALGEVQTITTLSPSFAELFPFNLSLRSSNPKHDFNSQYEDIVTDVSIEEKVVKSANTGASLSINMIDEVHKNSVDINLSSGTGKTIDRVPPVTGLSYIICVNGYYPGRL